MRKKKTPSPNTIVKNKLSAKEERLFQNLLTLVIQFSAGKTFSGMTTEQFMQRLSLPPQHTEMFENVLNKATALGHLESAGKRYSSKAVKVNLIKGLLHLNPRGFGFVKQDQPQTYTEDVFIPKHLTLNAVDGDHVEVEVNKIVSEKGPEGKVVAILSRSKTHVGGIICDIEPKGDIIAYVPMLGTGQRVIVAAKKKIPLTVGDRVILEVIEWGTKNTPTTCSLSSHIGHISDPSCDVDAAILEFGLRNEFPPHVIEEAVAYGNRVKPSEIRGRLDLRETECFTIDPDTAKDFDDAVSLTKDSKGFYHLGVHIADVSHYVHPGSALDDEARLRCNSTYFPGRCISMLPSQLSDNLCSLKANVNRLTLTVSMTFDKDGTLVDKKIERSVIRSTKRFTYREAKEVLDGTRKSPHLKTLQLMTELCRLLKRKRYERGSIEFCLPELVIKVDEKGVPYTTDYVEYDVTHQLVEEFMLKANETVAESLSKNGKNITYRVHEEPSEENLRDFSIMASAFGFKLSETPTPSEIQKLFDEALETPHGPYLATSYIRRMRLAAYSADNIGHYGLALQHYCHFTSPIRRYVDLVAHRILMGESDDRQEMEAIAQQCSDKERVSSKAENSVTTLKKLRLLETVSKKEPLRQYNAIVTRIKPFGIFFEVLEFMLEGFVHISELGTDYYVYNEATISLSGRHRGQTFHSGSKVTVMLRDVNLIYLETKWELIPEEPQNEEQSSSRKRNIRPEKRTRSEKRARPEERAKNFVSEDQPGERKSKRRRKR